MAGLLSGADWKRFAFPGATGDMSAPPIGLLNDIPSMSPTEDDVSRARKEAMFQLALGMLSRNPQAGMQNAMQAYQAGMNAPAQRLEAFKSYQDLQGKQLGNAKAYNDLQNTKQQQGLLSAASNTTASPFDLPSNAPYGLETSIGPLSMATPEMQSANTNARNSAMSNPAFLYQLAAAGMKGSDLKALQDTTRPYQQDPGKYYNGQYLGDPTKGVTMDRSGNVVNMPGYTSAMQDQTLANKAAEAFAEVQRRNMIDPKDVKKAGAIADAEANARDNYGFQVVEGLDGRKIFLTNKQAREAANPYTLPGSTANPYTLPGSTVSPQEQAKRDAVRRQILASEGRDPNMPTRLNDSVAGLAPQIAGIQGMSPVTQKAQESLNTNWVDKTFQPIMDAGAAAQGTLDNIRGLRNINLGTGMGTELKGQLAAFGAAFGIKDAEKYVSNIQQFRGLALDSVNKELNLAKGPQTEGDENRAQKIYANLGNTPQANEFILDYAEAVQRYRQRAAAFHQDGIAIARGTGDLTEVSRRWRKVAGSIWDDPVMQKWGK